MTIIKLIILTIITPLPKLPQLPIFNLVTPLFRLQQWAQREAFLELARREKEGEPLISKDFIPIDKISLPDDDELGNMPIII